MYLISLVSRAPFLENRSSYTSEIGKVPLDNYRLYFRVMCVLQEINIALNVEKTQFVYNFEDFYGSHEYNDHKK
jgi:hypothetical protein